MKIVLALIAIAVLTVAANAEGSGKGRRRQQDAPKAEDQAKKKASEEAYKNALKSIPVSNEKLTLGKPCVSRSQRNIVKLGSARTRDGVNTPRLHVVG